MDDRLQASKKSRIPRGNLLECGLPPIESIAEFARREGRRGRPVYSAHKWFARRLGTVIRALIVSAFTTSEDEFWDAYYGRRALDIRGAKVLDPFVGGGTTAFEAHRLGADVLASDLDAVACGITSFELKLGSLPDLSEALDQLKGSVGAAVRKYHVHRERHRTYSVLHHFWVQTVECVSCGHEFDAHPVFLLARHKERQWGICRSCGEIQQAPEGDDSFKCKSCGTTTRFNDGHVRHGKATCPDCGHSMPLIEMGRLRNAPPNWREFAVEAIEGHDTSRRVPISERLLLRSNDSDSALFQKAMQDLQVLRADDPTLLPDAPIDASGWQDGRLTAYGYSSWLELFNSRQLLHLAHLAKEIRTFDTPTREALSVVFSDHLTTNCMLTAYAASWRRLTPLFSLRAYRHIPRPVEVNPWFDGTGRGTFPNGVRKLSRGIGFAQKPREPKVDGGFQDVPMCSSENTPAVRVGAAQDLLWLEASSVDLVLTDPPYFDNIAYGDLADFFRPWQSWLGLLEPASESNAEKTLTLVRVPGSAEHDQSYAEALATAFSEIFRVLKPGGRLVFTYRHAKQMAWKVLGAALASSGLVAVRVLPFPGEGGVGPHVHDGTALWDAVLVLVKPGGDGRATGRSPESDAIVTEAVDSTRAWQERLKDAPIPFRDVDALNLLRACVVGAGLMRRGENPNPEATALSEALQLAEDRFQSIGGA